MISTDKRLWFSMVGSPAIWFTHFLSIWALGEFGCEISIGADTIKMLALLFTLVALPFTLTALLSAYQISRRSDDERRLFMARVGLIASTAFSIAVIFETIPIFMATSCGGIGGV